MVMSTMTLPADNLVILKFSAGRPEALARSFSTSRLKASRFEEPSSPVSWKGISSIIVSCTGACIGGEVWPKAPEDMGWGGGACICVGVWGGGVSCGGAAVAKRACVGAAIIVGGVACPERFPGVCPPGSWREIERDRQRERERETTHMYLYYVYTFINYIYIYTYMYL
jgi:hypothetical protein